MRILHNKTKAAQPDAPKTTRRLAFGYALILVSALVAQAAILALGLFLFYGSFIILHSMKKKTPGIIQVKPSAGMKPVHPAVTWGRKLI